MAGIRTFVAIDDATLEARTLSALDASGQFDRVEAGGDLLHAVETTGAELVVIRSETLDQDLLDRLAMAGGGRPVPSIVLVPSGTTPDRRMRPRLQQARCTTLSEALVLRPDDTAVEHVVERMRAVAERIRSGSRRTLSDTLIEDAIDAVVQSGERAGLPTDVAAFATWPVDLILLTGASDADEFLLEVFSEVVVAPVPILVALRGTDQAELARKLSAVSRIDVDQLAGWSSIRDIRGALVAPSRGVSLSGDRLSAGAPSDSGSYGRSLFTLGRLSTHLCAVMLEDPMVDIAREVSKLQSVGATVGVASPDATPRSAATRRLLDDGIATVSFDAAALAWYLGHAIPRRD